VKVRENCHPFLGPSEVPRAPVSTCEIIHRIVKWPPSLSLGRIQMLNIATCMKHGPSGTVTISAQKELAVNLADVAHTFQPRATICCETGR